jgi:anti-anti-sigma factor
MNIEPDHFAVSVVREGATIVVRVAGELDAATSPRLGEHLRAATTDTEITAVDFDLSELSFLDSSGLSVLVATARHCAVRVTAATESTRRVVEMTGLADVLNLSI